MFTPGNKSCLVPFSACSPGFPGDQVNNYVIRSELHWRDDMIRLDVIWRERHERKETLNKCVEHGYVSPLYVIMTDFMFIFLHRVKDLPFFRIQ